MGWIWIQRHHGKVLSVLLRQACLFAIVVAATGVVSCRSASPQGQNDPVYNVSAQDGEMNAAIASARSTLPEFYKHFQAPGAGETGFNLKLKVTDGDAVEHLWLGDLQGAPGKMTGVVGNDVERVTTVKAGQRIPIPEADISDWMYLRNDKIVGNRTALVLIKQMSPEDAKEAKSHFEDPKG